MVEKIHVFRFVQIDLYEGGAADDIYQEDQEQAGGDEGYFSGRGRRETKDEAGIEDHQFEAVAHIGDG